MSNENDNFNSPTNPNQGSVPPTPPGFKLKKAKKPPGIIRWSGIIPFVVICALIGSYMHFFFDTHLRLGMEWAGYKALGSEVNIAKVETSFLKASLSIQGLEITDFENPSQDSIKIGDIRFSMLWDALLRVKFVINEAAVEQIEFAVPRKTIGKVKPPEPVSNEPGAIDKLKEQALSTAQAQYNDNVLGDVVAMLGGTDANTQLQKIQDTLPSKAMLTKFDAELKAKQKNWDAKLKSLPQGPEIQALGDRLNKVKYKDFKSPVELQQSLQELDSLFKEADAKYKQIQSTSSELSKDLNDVQAQYKLLEQQIKLDITSLESRFRIPKIDAKSLSRAVFQKYLNPYLAKANRYRALAERYLPPKFLKKGDKQTEEADIAIQPHPREKGITYEFGRPNSYPLFWLKRTGVSSRAGAGTSPFAGNITGEILDITSNQKLTRKPTVATFTGNFPAAELTGLLVKISLDNIKPESVITYQASVGSYALNGKELVQSPEVQIAFKKAYGSMNLNGDLVALRRFTMNLDNQFTKIDYSVSAKNEIADQILKAVFAGIPVINLAAHAQGDLPGVGLDVSSNLGPELQKGFERQIQAKIDEARKKIQAYVDEQIGKQKAQIESEMNKAKAQINGEIQKVQAQLEAQKKQAEAKVDQAKKDATQQGTKKLEEEGKKALDSLKGQFGL